VQKTELWESPCSTERLPRRNGWERLAQRNASAAAGKEAPGRTIKAAKNKQKLKNRDFLFGPVGRLSAFPLIFLTSLNSHDISRGKKASSGFMRLDRRFSGLRMLGKSNTIRPDRKKEAT
jgi:hypothetical protein